MGTPDDGGLLNSPCEDEPRLSYGPLEAGSPRGSPRRDAGSPATRLAVSDKVLAVGHADGTVRLLDHLGNQVQSFKQHAREVTDLCFDEQAEHLASGAADGSIAVYGLYSDEVQRLQALHPVTTVALDPRYASRKTREVVYGSAAGALVLSSKGWLGTKESILYSGKGPVRCARMAGTLLAWATDTGIRVYDTASHTRLGKLERPASAGADPGAPCSLLWRGGRELLVGWGRQVTVVRVMGSLLPAGPHATHAAAVAAKRSLQIVASFDAGCSVLGAAPFGADLAVLCWGPAGGSGGEAASGSPRRGAVLDASSTADELPASSPAGGAAATADGPSQQQEQEAQPAGAAAAGTSDSQSPQQQEQQQQQPQPEEQQQQLGLCFFTRAGKLLAADELSMGCSAAQRRWHQLALLYPGDADLQLAAAAAGVGHGSGSGGGSCLPTPRQGSAAGSVAGSERSTPVKPAAASRHSDASPPAAGSGGEEQLPAGSERQQAEGGDGDGAAQQQQQQQQPAQAYKWWRDGEEPLYLISGPEGIVVGRPRDGNDRIAWLAERGRFAEALDVAEEDWTVTPGARDELGERYLQALAGAGKWAEAAALCPRVLQGNELAWERWAYSFAGARQLAAVAPALPVGDPLLKPSTYDMVLSALLLHPADHGVLLDCVRRWPQGAYDVAQLQAAVLQRMGGAGAGQWPALQGVAAHLYSVQGRHGEALRLQLALRSPAVFDYVARHALVGSLTPLVADLVDLDEVKATSLLVEHSEVVPPAAVVAALQDAGAAAGGDSAAAGRWRRRLHAYLDWLYQKDPAAAAPFAELQVELYAEYEPSRLLGFLVISAAYPLERAYAVCEARGLTREMVYVLGRMGSADKALCLIVEGLRDVAQAVEFVQLQRDDELWGQLIALALADAQLTGALLDHAGGYIDPLRVVSQIPAHMKVDNLRGRLVRVIADFRTQMSLQQGCAAILRTDCAVLANRLYRALRCSLRRLHLRLQQGGAAKWVLYDALSGEEAAQDDAATALLAGPPTPDGAAAAAAADGSPRPASHPEQAEQQRRVWVGIVGGPPPAASEPQAQLPARSPSKFPPRSPAAAGRFKVLVV